MNDSNIALVVSHLSARFADASSDSLALHGVSLVIEKGSFVTLLGPSGAGKSTLMRVVLGLMPHTKGEVVRNFKRPAMVFQNYALFPWLTALENVAFPLQMQGEGRRARERAALEKLREVGLAHLGGHYPSALSGGERQRVGLARALVMHPDFLVLDEPFSNLDTITAEALKADLLKIWREYGMTVCMVNHLIPDAVELSDQVILMSPRGGEIKKTVNIDLARPRDTRDPRFYARVDELTKCLRNV